MQTVNGIYINGKQSYAVFTQDSYGMETASEADKNIKLFDGAAELFEMVRSLKDCIKRLTQDDLTQYERDTEAQWEGEAHELLCRINPDYYRNANEIK